MAKSRLLPENTWYQWYEWITNHVPGSTKKSESDTKQKVIRLFESKVDDNTLSNYKTKKIRDAFDGRYVECKSQKDKISSLKEYGGNIRRQLRDMIDDPKNGKSKGMDGKYIWQWNLNLYHQQIVMKKVRCIIWVQEALFKNFLIHFCISIMRSSNVFFIMF